MYTPSSTLCSHDKKGPTPTAAAAVSLPTSKCVQTAASSVLQSVVLWGKMPSNQTEGALANIVLRCCTQLQTTLPPFTTAAAAA